MELPPRAPVASTALLEGACAGGGLRLAPIVLFPPGWSEWQERRRLAMVASQGIMWVLEPIQRRYDEQRERAAVVIQQQLRWRRRHRQARLRRVTFRPRQRRSEMVAAARHIQRHFRHRLMRKRKAGVPARSAAVVGLLADEVANRLETVWAPENGDLAQATPPAGGECQPSVRMRPVQRLAAVVAGLCLLVAARLLAVPNAALSSELVVGSAPASAAAAQVMAPTPPQAKAPVRRHEALTLLHSTALINKVAARLRVAGQHAHIASTPPRSPKLLASPQPNDAAPAAAPPAPSSCASRSAAVLAHVATELAADAALVKGVASTPSDDHSGLRKLRRSADVLNRIAIDLRESTQSTNVRPGDPPRGCAVHTAAILSRVAAELKATTALTDAKPWRFTMAARAFLQY